ncbi:MAG: hypothetical protein PHC51_01905, partial [bacterium]|nr:hypothetical protein [bacterium]
MQSHVTTAPEPNHVTDALQLLEEKNTEGLSQLLSEIHPVQLYNLINSVDENLQLELIKLISGLDQLAELIFQADDTMRERIVRMLDDARIAAVIRRQETDDAADIMQLLPRRKQIGILKKLSPETVKSLSALLSYDQDTAGGLMTPEFLSYPHSTPASQALSSIIEQLKSEEIDS